MTVKTKTLIENQSCEKCANFNILETAEPCVSCTKNTTYSQFRFSYEEKFRNMITDDTAALEAMVVIVSEQ